MSAPTSLGVSGPWEFLQWVLGVALFLAPGLAAVDRILGLRRLGWVFAPVFSFTLVPLGAILLDILFEVPVRTEETLLLCVAWTVGLQRHRLLDLWRAPRWPHLPVPTPRQWGRAGLLVLGLLFVAVCNSMPHLPGPDAEGWRTYPTFAARTADLLTNHDVPYPVHVDEFYHLAQQASLERSGHVSYPAPYTGEETGTEFFSVQGFRTERGFELAMVQVHQLTGLSLAAQFRFLPAVQSAVTALTLYALLWPAAGSIAAVVLVAAIPTSVRFLGPAFLVPSAFGLPWILASVKVALDVQGTRRLGGLALVQTGAFFMHLVVGTLSLGAAVLATVVRPGKWTDRAALLLACVLPLLWMGPIVWQDAFDAVRRTLNLPFQPAVFTSSGLFFLGLAAAGVALAWLTPAARPVHRALALLGVLLMGAMALSVAIGHNSDATYGRLIPTFFLCMAGMGSLALGWAWRQVQPRIDAAGAFPRVAGAVGALMGAVILALLLQPAVTSRIDEPVYHIVDDVAWEDARIVSRLNMSAGTFLSDPWQAPLFNAVGGGLPHAVLYPGSPPVGGADWREYLESKGAGPDWFKERGIRFVIGPGPPAAPNVHHGGRVYQLTYS
ncbi:MAG TPA: hypothetical protein VM286_00630 [Candidatus Thermoplasmatota archaeon]|nr:hypothetical protein [Candidatus Thermoplasmatota archaeon]